MTIRSNVELVVQLGQDAALTNLVFGRSLTQLLDSNEHATNHVITLAAGQTNYSVPFGDVAEARIVYIEADGDLNFTIGGSLATSGQIDAAGGTFPTTFAGGETLNLEVDGTPVAVAFLVGDQTLQQVINRVNAAAALLGFAPIASNNSGQLQLTSPTTGTGSSMEVVSGTSLATLGLSAATDTGANSTPGTSPVQLRASALESEGVTRYFLGSVKTTSLVLDNPDVTAAVNVKIAIAGDLTEASC